jgi:hypothetical protein
MGQSQFKKPVITELTEAEAEADYRAFYDSDVLRVWHLKDKERTFKIVGIARIESTFKGEDKKQPLIGLVDRRGNAVLPLALNKTNSKTIVGLYGNKPARWVGKTITLYPSMVDVGGEMKECIRVRPVIPGTGTQTKTNRNGVTVIKSAPESAEREPGDDTIDDEPPPGALESDNVIS